MRLTAAPAACVCGGESVLASSYLARRGLWALLAPPAFFGCTTSVRPLGPRCADWRRPHGQCRYGCVRQAVQRAAQAGRPQGAVSAVRGGDPGTIVGLGRCGAAVPRQCGTSWGGGNDGCGQSKASVGGSCSIARKQGDCLRWSEARSSRRTHGGRRWWLPLSPPGPVAGPAATLAPLGTAHGSGRVPGRQSSSSSATTTWIAPSAVAAPQAW